jgi:transcriptional regulator GlxA family with amidase domain
MKHEQDIFSPDSTPLRLGILVLPDSNLIVVAAVIDPLRAANRLAGRQIFSWQLYSVDGAPVALTSGISLDAPLLPDRIPEAALLVLAGFNLVEHTDSALIRRLRHLSPGLSGVGGIDGGGWVLARCGLLNGHTATTHWEDLEEMADTFPDINVVRDRFTISGRYFTAGGASPSIDMMLHLIRMRHGHQLAASVAGAFIYDPVHAGSDPQSFVSVARLQRSAPPVARAIRIMQDHLEDPLKISQISAQVGLSARRLEMLFRQEFSQGPGAYFRQMRLAEARRMTLESTLPLQAIAIRCGFNSQAAFSRAFHALYGQTPSSLRSRI